MEWNHFLEFLKGFNVQTIVTIGIMLFFFSRHMDSKIDALSNRMDQQSIRTDRRVYEMFIDLIKAMKITEKT